MSGDVIASRFPCEAISWVTIGSRGENIDLTGMKEVEGVKTGFLFDLDTVPTFCVE